MRLLGDSRTADCPRESELAEARADFVVHASSTPPRSETPSREDTNILTVWDVPA